jgi:glycosyltransferase involved in cell wall biosynthesis
MRIGIAIPCYKYHIPALGRCLKAIAEQTRLPDEVVVSCSSSLADDIPGYSLPFPFRVIVTQERKNAAENRNIAAGFLDTDIISFFDADDIMHPQRLEAIEKAFTSVTGCDIVLHSFLYGQPVDEPWVTYVDFQIRPNTLARAPTGCAIFTPNYRALIHHAQVSVRAGILTKVTFRENAIFENRTNEDALFCGDVLAIPSIQSAYIAVPLSKYYMEGQTHAV